MIHATRSAIGTVLRRRPHFETQFIAACSGAEIDRDNGFGFHVTAFTRPHARDLIEGRAPSVMPTCPVCVVLLDDAMLRRVSP